MLLHSHYDIWLFGEIFNLDLCSDFNPLSESRIGKLGFYLLPVQGISDIIAVGNVLSHTFILDPRDGPDGFNSVFLSVMDLVE